MKRNSLAALALSSALIASCGNDEIESNFLPTEDQSTETDTSKKPSESSRWRPTLEPFQILHLEDFDNPWEVIGDTKIINTELDQLSKEFTQQAKRRKIKIVAYMSATYEHWREDADDYPDDAKGKKMSRWNELWGNFTKPSLREFLERRMIRAKELGADGIEIDNVDIADNSTGFYVTREEATRALLDLADRAHKHGLAIFLKNAPELVPGLAERFDGVFSEQAIQYDEEHSYKAFTDKQKPLFVIEYQRSNCEAVENAIVQYKKSYFSEDFELCRAHFSDM